jgi:hypothetical protein
MLPQWQATFVLKAFQDATMDNDDERCCGTGTCIINDEGLCWCGQQWNGTTMCRPEAVATSAPASSPNDETLQQGEAP